MLELLKNVDDLLSRARSISVIDSRDPDLIRNLLSIARQLIETAEGLAVSETAESSELRSISQNDTSEAGKFRRFQEPHVNPGISRKIFDSFYKIRRVRDNIFQEPNIFGEPVWDMLLDLSMADRDRRSVSITSACIASCVPPTTALRWVSVLEAKGYIERTRDDEDARRSYLMVTDRTRSLMNKMSGELIRRQLL